MNMDWEDAIRAAKRAIDMLPIYGWVPCASAAQTESNPRRWSYGLGREPVGDFRPLFAPGPENLRVIHKHLEFGVDGLMLWLPYGNPSTGRLQSFDAWLTLTEDARKNIHDSLRLLDDEVQRRGLTRRTIIYLGAIRGETFAEARRPRFAPGKDDIDEEAAWRRTLACLGPALEIDCDIAIDNTGPAQDNPLHQRLLARLHNLLYKQGRKLYAEATVEKANTHQHGWPSVELEQAHTINRESLYEAGEILRILASPTIRRWRRETDVASWPIDGPMVLADAARRTVRTRRECSIIVAWDLVAGAKNADELRAKAKAILPTLPKPYFILKGPVPQRNR